MDREALDRGPVETFESRRTSRESMVPKKHFLVFCAIFLTVVVLLGLGAWRTRAEVESRVAPGRAGDPALEGGPAIRRAMDPPRGAPEDR